MISLCIYFSGVAAGVFPVMFVWVVLMAVCFFEGRAVAAHVGWVLVTWGIALAFVEEQTGFSVVTRWALGSFALVVATAVMNEIVGGRRALEEQLRVARDELQDLADHDPLTGVANRRLLKRVLARELARARRHGTPLAVIALDLDRFKAYNDLKGHAAGDELLQTATTEWARGLRAEDVIARLGGDEFLALLPDCPPAEAEQTAERLCSCLPPDCTCSTGTANWDGQESPEQLLERADAALYGAKHQHSHVRVLADP